MFFITAVTSRAISRGHFLHLLPVRYSNFNSKADCRASLNTVRVCLYRKRRANRTATYFSPFILKTTVGYSEFVTVILTNRTVTLRWKQFRLIVQTWKCCRLYYNTRVVVFFGYFIWMIRSVYVECHTLRRSVIVHWLIQGLLNCAHIDIAL